MRERYRRVQKYGVRERERRGKELLRITERERDWEKYIYICVKRERERIKGQKKKGLEGWETEGKGE